MPFALTEPRKARRVMEQIRDEKPLRWQDDAALLELQNIGAIARGPSDRWVLTEIGYSLLAGTD